MSAACQLEDSLISHKVILKLYCKSKFPHKSVNSRRAWSSPPSSAPHSSPSAETTPPNRFLSHQTGFYPTKQVCIPHRFRCKVDGFVPDTQRVNFRKVGSWSRAPPPLPSAGTTPPDRFKNLFGHEPVVWSVPFSTLERPILNLNPQPTLSRFRSKVDGCCTVGSACQLEDSR